MRSILSVLVCYNRIIKHARIDIGLSRKPIGITTVVNAVRSLVNPYPVHRHCDGKRKVRQVNPAKICGHSQIDDDIL